MSPKETDPKNRGSSNRDTNRRAPYRQELKQAMREQIVRSAEYVFAEKGFGKAKIEEIADRAGVAAGTIYLYFENKEDLYFKLIHNKIDQLVASIDESLGDATSSFEKIRRITHAQLRFFEANELFFKIYLHETRGFEWNLQLKFGKKTMARYRDHLEFLSKTFEDGIGSGEFVNTIAPLDMAIGLQGIINSFAAYWMQQDVPRTALENTALILEIFFKPMIPVNPRYTNKGVKKGSSEP